MIVVEITAAIDAAGHTQVFYLSTDAFTTRHSGDTPADTYFVGSLIDPGSFGSVLYKDGRTGGGTQLQTGQIVLVNEDGGYDAWVNYSFDGRPITVRLGDLGAAYPSAFTTLFNGTVESVDVTWDKAVIKVKDNQFVFQVPMLQNYYGGTNSLPNGVDGTANDIKGTAKPRVYGKVYNVPVSNYLVNTSLLIYQVSDRAVLDIPAVYDRGASLTKGADFATNALLQAATVTAGTYATCFAEGLFRLGATPTGAVTADVTEGAASSNRTAAQIVKKMATDAGISLISATDVTAMDTANSAELGIWITDTTTFASAMDAIISGVGGAYWFDGTGTLRMGILVAPSGSPAFSLQDFQVLAFERTTPSQTTIPPYAVQLNHSRVYQTQDTDLAGSVTAAQRAFLATETRSVVVQDASVKTKYLLSTILSRDTLLADKTGATATTEATRLLNLLKGAPNMFQATLPLDIIKGTSLTFLTVVSCVINRFGMSGGKLLVVVGIDLELAGNAVILTLWG